MTNTEGGTAVRTAAGRSWDKAQRKSSSRLQPEGAGQMENSLFAQRNATSAGHEAEQHGVR